MTMTETMGLPQFVKAVPVTNDQKKFSILLALRQALSKTRAFIAALPARLRHAGEWAARKTHTTEFFATAKTYGATIWAWVQRVVGKAGFIGLGIMALTTSTGRAAITWVGDKIAAVGRGIRNGIAKVMSWFGSPGKTAAVWFITKTSAAWSMVKGIGQKIKTVTAPVTGLHSPILGVARGAGAAVLAVRVLSAFIPMGGALVTVVSALAVWFGANDEARGYATKSVRRVIAGGKNTWTSNATGVTTEVAFNKNAVADAAQTVTEHGKASVVDLNKKFAEDQKGDHLTTSQRKAKKMADAAARRQNARV